VHFLVNILNANLNINIIVHFDFFLKVMKNDLFQNKTLYIMLHCIYVKLNI